MKKWGCCLGRVEGKAGRETEICVPGTDPTSLCVIVHHPHTSIANRTENTGTTVGREFSLTPPTHLHCIHCRYEEAAKMKNKADELMTWEEEKWHNERQAEMYSKEMRFKKKLKTELIALKKRIQLGKAEMKRQRQRELQRLLQRYQNVKRELDRQHSLERVRMDKVSKNANKSRAAAKARR